ncbi:MAG: DUF1963 domain-containing protein [Zoogloeaceae bacterium]|nr:DUF1963 domain-containing protein [Zoogloeaceae bacterium]
MINIPGNRFKSGRKAAPMRDISALTSNFAVPAVQVILQDHPSLSNFGGQPCLPPGVGWPEKEGRELAFLARISLAEVHCAVAIDWLPTTGALLFFYDMEQEPWGFDPKDRGSWSVLHVSDLEQPLEPTDQAGNSSIPFKHAGFRGVDSYPSCRRGSVAALEPTDAEEERYAEFVDLPYKGKPKHQISGFPDPVQGDHMELECQLASNGLYCGDASGYDDPRAQSLQDGAIEWKLLFQFDSDDDLDVMWGDSGTLYYWIREQSARSGDFSNPWLVLQCC